MGKNLTFKAVTRAITKTTVSEEERRGRKRSGVEGGQSQSKWVRNDGGKREKKEEAREA